MSTINSVFQQSNPYEQFVRQLVALESQTKLKLEAQQSAEKEKKQALGAVSSSISTWISNMEELQDPKNRAFHPMKTASSDKSVATLSQAEGLQSSRSYQLTIDRLASRDVMLGNLMTGTDTDLAGQGDGSITLTLGEQTETISIETHAEDGDGVLQPKTNQELLSELEDAIQDRFGDALVAQTFHVDDTNVRFSLQSGETGSDHRIEFTGGSGWLATIQGDMAHLETDPEQLDAKFELNGVSILRSSNQIDDVIDGITLELKKPSTEEITLSADRDLNKVVDNIQQFVDGFNNVNKTIRDRTFIDSDTDRRGALQDMRSVRNFTYMMRQTGLQPMDGAADGELARLSEIGISFERDGTMTIEDKDLLRQLLTEKPDEVEELLTGDGSVLNTMKLDAENYIESEGGILPSLEGGLDMTIDRLDRRIASQERYLERYEEQQRTMFNELQQIIMQGEQQFAQVSQFRARMGY
ncbi:MAG: flagellar filament capping protein FliD [Balneolaceae bacterium]